MDDIEKKIIDGIIAELPEKEIRMTIAKLTDEQLEVWIKILEKIKEKRALFKN